MSETLKNNTDEDVHSGADGLKKENEHLKHIMELILKESQKTIDTVKEQGNTVTRDIPPIDKKLSKILKEQIYPKNNILDTLISIFNTEYNKRQRKCGGVLSTIVDCYQYGVVMGKRQERAKHKTKARK
ncbi:MULTISPECIES: hypothetical protein [Clostridium]|uniref:hypothetical protein n=1 Tax=Clostridium TaxID=1485 RepID=UPI000826F104|nr:MULTISPECIES: hypothetical protein [Clostridium]PJI08317.1 hypothetical protein CUB90_10770 [Clostridium sp. CT7]